LYSDAESARKDSTWHINYIPVTGNAQFWPGSSFSQRVKGTAERRDKMDRNMVSEVAQVYKLLNEYAAAAIDGDIERWMSLWIDDGIQMPPDVPRRVGKEHIRREMQPGFSIFDMSNMIIQTEEVRILGDRAYSHGTYTFEMTPKKGGETKSYSGKFLDILEKQADGSWKIAIDCHNYNAPAK